ncbi:MAG: hypothetical protein HY683_07730 [Chloroflexi bacterium]|nr:hypothetical protein [Chloroflexota bacterium]
MSRVIAQEVLVAAGVAAAAAVLLLLAGLVGIAFTAQTYLWSLGVLYGLRVLAWAIQTMRRGGAASLPPK